MKYVAVVEKSGDRKLTRNRNLSATWVPQQTCHSDCRLQNNGCYAEYHRAGLHTHRLNHRVARLRVSLSQLRLKLALEEALGIFKLTGKRKLRVHVVGDCATAKTAGIVGKAMVAHEKKHGKAAWTYTHSWRRFGPKAWRGARVLASCETPQDARLAMARGYAVALIVPPHPTNKVYPYDGLNVVPCPAQTSEIVTCEDCTLCQNPKMLLNRNLVVGFEPHGAAEKRINRMLEELNGNQ